MKKLTKSLLMLCCFSLLFSSCKTKPATSDVKANYPDWAKNAVIYEVNVRQYTPEGTFKAFEAKLPQLKELGVDILWIMPINPIGIKNRKVPDGMTSSLGSYYSVKDYKGTNPEFGTEADFKSLVAKAHELGFKVIIDWVANHTSWDNAWLTEHPEWYKTDSLGKPLSPFDWTDVVSLNYRDKNLHLAMIDAMKYWIEKCDIDGFRCDVAGLVPVEFWEEARTELVKVKPIFMLAEDESKTEIFKSAFDMGYGWSLHGIWHQIAQGKDSVPSILKYQTNLDSLFPKTAMKMNFVTNHDENSWNGTVKEKFGDGGKTFAVLTYTMPGMPLIYSGQEANLSKRLKFFTKDTINWDNKELIPFYQTLNKLKHENPALLCPPYGSVFKNISNSLSSKVFSFVREKDNAKIFVIANLSPAPVTVSLKDEAANGTYKDVFSGQESTVKVGENINLEAWGYKLLEKK